MCGRKSRPPIKSKTPAEVRHSAGVTKTGLLALLLRGHVGCLRRLSRLGLGHALLEFIDASSRIYKLLRASIERVAGIADTDNNYRLGRTCLDHVSASTANFSILVSRMNISFHIKGGTQ